MERVEKTIFLSYRRTNIPWALAIYQNLTHHGYDIFFDYSGIASGDFDSVIVGNIISRAHFLVLLTPSALERCGEPGDWLRREIETALDKKRNIVPLMLEGFDFGAPGIANQLTGTLEGLKRYNALRIVPDYFDEGMERLRKKYLSVALTAVPHPPSTAAKEAAVEQKEAANAAPAVREQELTAQQWFERGVAATDHDEEIRCFSEAIRLEPDAYAFFNRGWARHEKGDLDGALKDYNEAIRLEPDFAAAFNNLGITRQAKGDLDGALKDYTEAIRLNPDDAEAFYNRGTTRQAKGDLDGALKDYTEAIRLNPDDAEAFYNRGITRKKKGDLDGSLKDYTEAIRLKPDYAKAFYNRGNASHEKGDLDGALADYGEAIRLKPDHAAALNNRAAARLEKGDPDGALEDSNKAIHLKPDLANAFHNRALARQAKGDQAGAQQDFAEAKRLGYKP